MSRAQDIRNSCKENLDSLVEEIFNWILDEFERQIENNSFCPKVILFRNFDGEKLYMKTPLGDVPYNKDLKGLLTLRENCIILFSALEKLIEKEDGLFSELEENTKLPGMIDYVVAITVYLDF